MSRIDGNRFIFEEQPPAKCELCGKFAELRPYGPNNENICFDCGIRNNKTTEQQFNKILEKVSHCVIVPKGNTQN